MLVYAHRGFSGKFPENTMLAFQKAIEAGCDGIELDVQFSKDNVMVLIHDEKIDRTSDHKGYVRDYTYAQLCTFDFSYKFKEFGFQKIPTLNEYFDLVKDLPVITNIELKTGIFEYPGLEEAVYNLICQYHLQDRVVISSFNHGSVLRMKRLDSNLICGFLTDCCMLSPAKYTASYGIEGYHPRFNSLNKKGMEEFHRMNVRVNTWTVNKKKDIERMIGLGVDGIITNFPDLAAECLYQDFNLSEKMAVSCLESRYDEAKSILEDEDRVEAFLQKLEKKLKGIPRCGKRLSEIPVMISLVRSYVKKEYRDIPVASMVAIVAALIYFLAPVDLIPDSLPFIGFLDDATVIHACWKLVEIDVEKYLAWREAKKKG